jgi:SnoaL-like domain
MTIDAALQRLLDEHEIRDLAIRYAVAISSADIDALPDLFDPAVDNGRFGPGREGVRAYYAEYFEQNQRHPFHHIGTHQVDLIDDTTASGICLNRSWSGTPEAGFTDIMVVYFDTYRKTDGCWGFVHRRETLHDMVPGPVRSEPLAVPGSTLRGAIPRAWDYWDRWKERKAEGKLFRE